MISVNREALLGALERCSKITPQRSTVPIVQNALLSFGDGELSYRATDLRCELSGSIPASGEGSFLVKPRDLASALSALSGESATLKVSPGNVEVRGETKRSFEIETLSVEEFPPGLGDDAGKAIEIDATVLSELVGRVLHAVRNDDDKPWQRQLRIDSADGNLRATATDGHRAAIATSPSAAKLSLCIPPEIARAIVAQKSGGIRLASSQRCVCVELGNEKLTSLAAADGFPPIEGQILSIKPAHKATVNIAALLDAVKAIQRVDSERDVLFRFKPGKLELECMGGGRGSDEVEIDCDAEAELYLYGSYVVDALSALTGEVALGFDSEGLEPMTMNVPGWTGIIVPRRPDVVRAKPRGGKK